MDKLLIIGGPTASGKTSLSIELAKKLNGEIISADSMQVYKYMDIGTAKVRKDEMQGIKHYLIDEFYPDEEFSIAIFKKRAMECIKEIQSKNKLPIMVGGTGFYINSVVYNTNFDEEDNDYDYRKELEEIYNQKGKDYLYNMLKEVDIKSCETIHPNNTRRVIRALEFYNKNGFPISEHNRREKDKEAYFDYKMIVVNLPREELYERINKRVDIMVNDGLEEEVSSLLNMGYGPELNSMQGIGYKEMAMYLTGQITLNEAIELIKRESRRFAKRQVTWFKHQSDGQWFNPKINTINELELWR